jgi:DNA repair exonuclease SbcCD ATPase subunit
MKIASVSLKNFRSYVEADFVFDQPLTIIRAANGSGKTSLQQAIELTLTSRTDGTDPRGAGANTKIRNGAKKALLEVVLQTAKGPITLKTSYGPNKIGRQVTISAPEFEQRFMDPNKERLSCVLNTRYFTGLKPKEQADVLASLVLPTTYAFDPAIMELVNKRLGVFNLNQRPVALIDQIYVAAYDARKSAKAAMGAIYIPARPTVPAYTSEHIQGLLATLRGSAAKESKKLAGAGKSAIVARLEGDLVREQEKVDADRKQLKRQVSILEAYGNLLDAATVKKHQIIAAGRRIFDELQGRIDEANGEIAAQKSAIQVYLGLFEEPFCPTCTQAITKEFIDRKIEEHRSIEKEELERIRGFQKEQQALGDIAGSEKALIHDSQARASIKLEEEALARLEGLVKLGEQTITDIAAKLENAKAIEELPRDTTVLDELNAQIAGWEVQLAPAISYESTLAQIERETKRLEDQKLVVADLETLCSYFGKDGVKAKLIAEHIDAFTTTVNGVLQTWGFKATLAFDPYQFIVTGEHGELPLEELSGGETFMFCAALQCAIAIHGNIKTVVIDEADTLVDQARNKLMGCIYKLVMQTKQLDQAIILEASTNNKVSVERPGVRYYQISEGKVGPPL